MLYKALVLGGVALAFAGADISDPEWDKFKKQFKKHYKSKDDETARYAHARKKKTVPPSTSLSPFAPFFSHALTGLK